MVKRFTVLGALAVFLALAACPVRAQFGSLTMPGSMPTLAPLSLPFNSLAVSPTETPAPTAVPQQTDKKQTAATPSGITKLLGGTGMYVIRLIQQLKLGGSLKQIALQMLHNALDFLKAYNANIDPLIRNWLTQAARKLPENARHIASLFIPFLTMAGEVILGVIGGILLIKIVLALIDRLILGMFRRKRRR